MGNKLIKRLEIRNNTMNGKPDSLIVFNDNSVVHGNPAWNEVKDWMTASKQFRQLPFYRRKMLTYDNRNTVGSVINNFLRDSLYKGKKVKDTAAEIYNIWFGPEDYPEEHLQK